MACSGPFDSISQFGATTEDEFNAGDETRNVAGQEQANLPDLFSGTKATGPLLADDLSSMA